ncbi:uncharacterized protein LOC143291471 [Babylonia areolata]|uniref:uncharacterized protein LOC143291471 n=1 Tax=Babylonia areolata TaxID=304850 RepID=UPI003FD63ECA
MSSNTSSINSATPTAREGGGAGSAVKTMNTLEAPAVHGVHRAPSPGVDVHAVLGVPRPKRGSSEEAAAAGSDSDDVSDSDDDTEEWQEGVYDVMDGEEDEEHKELRTQMNSESATRTRHSLVPIFTACCAAYNTWIGNHASSLSETDLSKRRRQLQLYREVLELYGTDAEWKGLTHAQRVERNRKAHDASMEAKSLGPPPSAIAEVMVELQQN